MVLKCINHSRKSIDIAIKYGWLPGAKYTNLRDIRTYKSVGLLDIDWKNYCFKTHLSAVQKFRPHYTVARDIVDSKDLESILEEANELQKFSTKIIIVPKDTKLAPIINSKKIPENYIIGYSVPSKYGGTEIPPNEFKRPVHLLGGRPDVQRRLGDLMPVVSLDCNRFTLDAEYGDYFDGDKFRKHPIGGYALCIEDSIKNINELWKNYEVKNNANQYAESTANNTATSSNAITNSTGSIPSVDTKNSDDASSSTAFC